MSEGSSLIPEVWRRLSATERWWLVVLTGIGGALVLISSSADPGWMQDAMLGIGTTTVLAVPLLLLGLVVQRGVSEAEREAQAAREEAERARRTISAVHETTVHLVGVVDRLVARTEAIERERNAAAVDHGELWIEVVAVLDQLTRSGRMGVQGFRVPIGFDRHLRLSRINAGVKLSVEGPATTEGPTMTQIWEREDDLPVLLADFARALAVKGVAVSESKHLLPGVVRWAEAAKRLASAADEDVSPLVIQDLGNGFYITQRGLAHPIQSLLVEVPDLDAAAEATDDPTLAAAIAEARRVHGLGD